MKRNMFWGLTAVVLALVINVAFAQSATKSKADVPFAFTVDQNSMSAGHYSIIEISDRTLQIRNDDTKTSVAVIALREESLKPQSSRLVFHKYGDRYFLAEVWSESGGGSGSRGVEFPTSKWENEMRTAFKNTGGGTEVVVALR